MNPIMNDQKYDVIVIGTRPRGEGAAIKAAKKNPSVAVIHRDSLKILGTRCSGDQAAEIAYTDQAIMAQQGAASTLRYFVNTTFNYPTLAEAYRIAALNGSNRPA